MKYHEKTDRRSPSLELLAVERTIFNRQLGLATRPQLLEEGITPKQVRTALGQGRWLRPVPGLYALATWPCTSTRYLLAGCLLTGGIASHASAAWLWGLLRTEPTPLTVSVPHDRYSSRQGRARYLRRCELPGRRGASQPRPFERLDLDPGTGADYEPPSEPGRYGRRLAAGTPRRSP